MSTACGEPLRRPPWGARTRAGQDDDRWDGSLPWGGTHPLEKPREERPIRPHRADAAEPVVLPRVVLDVDRRPVTVVPGRWDAAAEHVFAHGQCLALALAVARSTGRPVAAHTMRHRGAEVLRHCYAHLDGTGTVVDVSGAHDLRAVRSVAERRPGERVRTMTPRAAWAGFAGGLVPQDVPLAGSFVHELLGRPRGAGRGAHAAGPAGRPPDPVRG